MLPARALTLVLLAACVEPTDVGQTTQNIFGGTTTTSAQFPTVVGLLAGNNNWFCTGVLVDKDWVLTTASCFEGVGTQVQARFDDANLNDGGGRTVTIAEIHKHTQYNINSSTWNHDIAMLKLAQSVTDRTPATIHRQSLSVGSSVMQVGFGTTGGNNGGGVLRSLTTTTLDCAQAGDTGISNANLLCFNADDGNGSCYGDGGAPAFSNGAVAGLASGGTANSCTDGLDVYTAIAPELAFIDTFLPMSTPPSPPPMDNDDPPPTDDPVDPDDEGEKDDDKPLNPVRGCSTGGGTGGLFALGLALLVLRRRR